ncbi:hypothetical protein Ae168Ps1_0769c [Pseudonocardia sp. Ae168_Ps1]|nr:hypothetical protein Ae150APs1_0769c [Pseudonocardia sp. Ae150A_Ps1]OLL78363.1 hypothetical protein Ae168Ps1_0769c [Pseudonocardia sp. Ae168_Ps1]OLL87511.1 hypothetical protein Ae263Ps1_4566 [Pseudonocardia sp. Ae263_Ps1]OLL92459.1 hypothetical protein Ae356Ps1_2356c [Pseudonocardia sp. Ae356_Ps1]
MGRCGRQKCSTTATGLVPATGVPGAAWRRPDHVMFASGVPVRSGRPVRIAF